MRRIVPMMLAVGLLGAACGSGDAAPAEPSGASAGGSTASEVPVPDPIEGCVPRCNPPGLVAPGPMPTGPYETQWFFGGEMVITLDEPWSVHEDSTGEFALELRSTPENGVYF